MCCLRSFEMLKDLVVSLLTKTCLKLIFWGPAIIFCSCSPVSSTWQSRSSFCVVGSALNFFLTMRLSAYCLRARMRSKLVAVGSYLPMGFST